MGRRAPGDRPSAVTGGRSAHKRAAGARRPRGPGRAPAEAAALAELRTLQEEYQAWRDGLPESLADSRTAELLEHVCDVELPRGFGRD